MSFFLRSLAVLVVAGIVALGSPSAAHAVERTVPATVVISVVSGSSESTKVTTVGYVWSGKSVVARKVVNTDKDTLGVIRETRDVAVTWLNGKVEAGWDWTRTVVINGKERAVEIFGWAVDRTGRVIVLAQDRAGEVWAWVQDKAEQGKGKILEVKTWAVDTFNNALDVNGDGEVNMEDAQDAVDNVVDAIMDPLDVDGDGDVDWDDLTKATGDLYWAIWTFLVGG